MLPNLHSTKVSATLPVFPKSYYAYPQLLIRKANVLAAKAGARIFGEFSVPDMVDYGRIPELPLVWKSIESTGRMGLLCRALVRCRAVLILRHPCGYVASVVRGEAAHKFEGRTRSHEDFGLFAKMIETEQARRYGLTVDALKAMHPLERLAWRWAIYYEKAIDDTAELENCRYVLYENICKQPYDESRGLFNFTGLRWNEQTTNFPPTIPYSRTRSSLLIAGEANSRSRISNA
jgi:hypothetical protein